MLTILAAVLPPFFIAGFVDFWMKERTKRRLKRLGKGWSDMPAYLMHEQGWHWYISGIWAALLIVQVAVFGGPWQILLGAVIFSTEDIAYYCFTWVAYRGTMRGEFLPAELPWLHGGIPLLRLLVGDRFPRRNFLLFYLAQWVLFTAMVSFFLT